MKNYFCRIVIITLAFLGLSKPLQAAGIVVNIDSPQFREVVAAVPGFALAKSSNDAAKHVE